MTRHGGTSRRPRQLALVLWNGNIGGAERMTVSLGERLRSLGAEVTVVFVQHPHPLAERLETVGLPYRCLGLRRGRAVVRHPRRYAKVVADVGRDGALLASRGVLGAALRGGGYGGPIVAVEHGDLLELPKLPWPRRLAYRLALVGGAHASDAEVAVSRFVLDAMHTHAHARPIRLIPNGIDPNDYRPVFAAPTIRHSATIGFGGRLVTGKGADRLIEAVAELPRTCPASVIIAGEGPDRASLEAMAARLGVADNVQFVGLVDDMPEFWGATDIVAVPPDTLSESFSMVTLEAMICGRPVVATRSGAIPELVIDGVTGTLVPPGDVRALSGALLAYAMQPRLRAAHGEAAHARAVAQYDISDCALAYLELFDSLAARQLPVAGPVNKLGPARWRPAGRA